MRGLTLFAALLASGTVGCVELGVITDGTSVSVGRPSNGYLRDGHRLPDRGEGFVTREPWKQRGNRYGTDELLDLVTGVGRRLATQPGPRLVVADLSGPNGGESRKWHRSHQSGRDVDLVYFMRDAQGKPFEADAMRVFDPHGKARDDSGITVDLPRTWLLVKELVTAHEATVQWVFMYEPIAQKLLEHARAHDEPEELIARVRLALKQPGDSAPHNDHMHVRVYCSDRDRSLGCVDIGPMELYALRESERAAAGEYAAIIALFLGDATHTLATEVLATATSATEAEPPTVVATTTPGSAGDAAAAVAVTTPAGGAPRPVSAVMGVPRDLPSLGRMLRRPFDRIFERRWP